MSSSPLQLSFGPPVPLQVYSLPSVQLTYSKLGCSPSVLDVLRAPIRLRSSSRYSRSVEYQNGLRANTLSLLNTQIFLSRLKPQKRDSHKRILEKTKPRYKMLTRYICLILRPDLPKTHTENLPLVCYL
ncbi:hypothetical protein TIFTF001_021357 [Ficus carica]|uniref:Uncharacterized protein n=1 Tax=Ficus carica TaxID=3494 RepID=A0AA88DEH5_FICCA|nr:hypothetical protein TIFTF001_021357 [Ficus carica]